MMSAQIHCTVSQVLNKNAKYAIMDPISDEVDSSSDIRVRLEVNKLPAVYFHLSDCFI